jgi:hypothetical protein
MSRSIVGGVLAALLVACGGTGPQGPQGPEGPEGQPGAFVEEPVDAGGACQYGGVDLVLTDGGALFVCNGAPGTNGLAGQSVGLSVEDAGANCGAGGVHLVAASGSAYVCSGAPGAAGAAGATGPSGPTGATGAQGVAGAQGPAGLQGSAGPQGPSGANGAAGPQGPAGPAGSAGPQGPTGLTGATGPQGPPGISGVGPLSIRDTSNADQFDITGTGGPGLQFAAGSGMSVAFDSTNQRVTYSHTGATGTVVTNTGSCNGTTAPCFLSAIATCPFGSVIGGCSYNPSFACIDGSVGVTSLFNVGQNQCLASMYNNSIHGICGGQSLSVTAIAWCVVAP